MNERPVKSNFFIMIKNKAQLYKETDDEIIRFFESAVFRGQFTESIPPQHRDTFCGQVTDITINGESNSLCPSNIFVPKKIGRIEVTKFLKEGSCEFIASVNPRDLRDKKKYRLYISRITNIVLPEVEHFDKKEEEIFRRNLKLKDNQFIGQFTKNKDSSFTIRDIRRSDFSKLILQNGEDQKPIVFHPKIMKPTDEKYYEFSWVLNRAKKDDYVYMFKVDESKPFTEITSKILIEKLHNDIMSYPAGAGQKIVKMLDTLKNQLTASGKEIFIYELLQNANDYPHDSRGMKEMVDVEFHITKDSLLFLHSGAEFNEKNIAAICSINDKEKTDNKETIGYKGIGFKTVFIDNNYVYLQSGDSSFRFDREESKDIVDTPWQILPIWTNYLELTPSERYVFTNAESKFRVKFALRPTHKKTLRDSPQNYVNMFKDVFYTERVILFIPNLSSVKVFYSATPEPDIICLRDSEHWQIDEFVEDVPQEVTESVNEDIDDQEDSGSLKIPTKYYDFTKTKVSFACEVEGSKLKEVDDTTIYCYLPTKASWGFKFLMNTDMIPTGPRDDIEIEFSDQININAEIADIAGQKFFDWILKLCALNKYELHTIFNLIPVFETNIREHGKYKALIERFQEGFETQLESREFIPINSRDYALISHVILDETGLMASNIMDDEVFYRITGGQEVLPIKELRNDKNFKAFLRRYLKMWDHENNIWNFEDLKSYCSSDVFKEWLGQPENNHRFLEFLLKKDKLGEFMEEEIFIEEKSGELYRASDLYYDIDEHLVNLQSFSLHLPHLSLATREYFRENRDWLENAIENFNSFDPDRFVKEVLLSRHERSDTMEKLESKITSLHFFKFLALNNVSASDDFFILPFINDRDEIVHDFSAFMLFFSSEHGREVVQAKWLHDIAIEFVSPDYDERVKDYFRSTLNVRDFSDEIVINDIILNEDYRDGIAAIISEDFEKNNDFVLYCYNNKELFDSGDLCKYPLRVFDLDGDEQWCLTEEHIFFNSELYDRLSGKEWLYNEWMYVLDDEYMTGVYDVNDFKNFLTEKFEVEELTDRNFYRYVVKENISDIIESTSGDSDQDGSKNTDFVRYLDENYHLIFEEERDVDVFKDFKPVSYDGCDLSLEGRLYLYDDELVELISFSWFPEDIIYLCNKEYGSSRALLAMGCKSYKFGEFFDELIVSELDAINNNIYDKETSISFHSFIINHLGSLTNDQQSKMVNANVFLYGHDDSAPTSTGHKTLSAKAKELFEKGLVEFADLDLIDPDYKTEQNTEYWETRLDNTKFTVNHFFSWLDKNTSTFSATIENESLNIEFWRWVKEDVSDTFIEGIPELPVLLKDGRIVNNSETIYFSDEFLEGSSIEQFVKRFDENALFLSPNYMKDNEDAGEWLAFWEKIGVKNETVDILIGTIIPNLSDIDDEGLPKLIADNRDILEKRYDGNLIEQLVNMRVKARDGKFYAVDDTIFTDCEKDEPFPYITLPNQINLHSPAERRLIKDIFDEMGVDYVSTLSEWQQHKLDSYLTMQSEDSDLIRGFHYQFINELSNVINTKRDSLQEVERIDEILLLNKDNEFYEASSLTMGSIYKPSFDFENCGVDTLEYLNDDYEGACAEDIRKLLKELEVHSDIRADDLGILEHRGPAIYFWGTYLSKKDASLSRIKKFIADNLFDDIACIPTKDYMKRPDELYYGSEVSQYIKAVYDWKNKIPLEDLHGIKLSDGTSIFDELPFKESLDFLDTLHALYNIKAKSRRKQLLDWMIESYEENYDSAYDNEILYYRENEHAVWENSKNERIQIKELYALDHEDLKMGLYFGTHPKIINKEYFPSGKSFKKACDILGIKTITSDSLRMDPVNANPDESRNEDLKLFALVIAGSIDNESWKAHYDNYREKLSELSLHRCSSIRITYTEDEEIYQAIRKFYHEKGSNDFYFVKSLDSKLVYSEFVREFLNYLGISDIDEYVVETIIMDSRDSAIAFAIDNNSLMLDDSFIEELEKLAPEMKGEFKGNEADVDNELDDEYIHVPVTQGDENSISDTSDDSEAEVSDDGKIFTPSQVTTTTNDSTSENDDENLGNYSDEEDELVEGLQEGDYNKDLDENGYERIVTSPKPFSKDEVDRLRSNVTPLELGSLPVTADEKDALANIGISPEQIADTNYLAKLRLYNIIIEELKDEPEENLEAFVRNSAKVTTHALKSGKYIHACSAASGVMYISPSVWNKMLDDKCIICVYLDGEGKDFEFIHSEKDFLKLVEKDDVVIKITGKEKVDVVKQLYSGFLKDTKGTAYTLIRVARQTSIDTIFARYVGSMAESDDGNEVYDTSEY